MPLLASRGGGSARGFGRANRNLLKADSDNFNRSVSGSIGNSSNKNSLWTTYRGTWETNGTKATSGTAAGTNSIATISADGTTISNLQVDTENTGGVGVAFWVVDNNNWFAATTYYSTSTSSSTTTTCTGGGAGPQAGGYPGGCCSGHYTTTLYCSSKQCNNGAETTVCATGSYPGNNFDCNCCGRGGVSSQGSYTTTGYGCSATNVSNTTTTTNYLSNFRLINNGNLLVNTQYNSNTSAYQTAGSIAISTSGNTISYYVYSGANKGGSLLHSGSYNASSPNKGSGIGVFKGDGGNSQGSSVDNFEFTVA